MPNSKDNVVVRTRLDETDDSGKQQMMTFRGRRKEKMGGKQKVMRLQSYGVSEHPPKGSQGVTTIPGGSPSLAMVMGMEHPDHRPKNLAEGEGKIYDMWGGNLYKQEDKWTITKGGSSIVMYDDGHIDIIADTINIVGNVHVGGYGGVKASKDGTVDSAGDVDTSNFANKVWVV